MSSVTAYSVIHPRVAGLKVHAKGLTRSHLPQCFRAIQKSTVICFSLPLVLRLGARTTDVFPKGSKLDMERRRGARRLCVENMRVFRSLALRAARTFFQLGNGFLGFSFSVHLKLNIVCFLLQLCGMDFDELCRKKHLVRTRIGQMCFQIAPPR